MFSTVKLAVMAVTAMIIRLLRLFLFFVVRWASYLDISVFMYSFCIHDLMYILTLQMMSLVLH